MGSIETCLQFVAGHIEQSLLDVFFSACGLLKDQQLASQGRRGKQCARYFLAAGLACAVAHGPWCCYLSPSVQNSRAGAPLAAQKHVGHFTFCWMDKLTFLIKARVS
eukprot:gene17156-biopygen12791